MSACTNYHILVNMSDDDNDVDEGGDDDDRTPLRHPKLL